MREDGAYAGSNPFRYSTKYTDVETDLVYYGLRYYSPKLGRFINTDPIEEAGGVNLYAFCGNNGVNSSDYLGMGEWDDIPSFSTSLYYPGSFTTSTNAYRDFLAYANSGFGSSSSGSFSFSFSSGGYLPNYYLPSTARSGGTVFVAPATPRDYGTPTQAPPDPAGVGNRTNTAQQRAIATNTGSTNVAGGVNAPSGQPLWQRAFYGVADTVRSVVDFHLGVSYGWAEANGFVSAVNGEIINGDGSRNDEATMGRTLGHGLALVQGAVETAGGFVLTAVGGTVEVVTLGGASPIAIPVSGLGIVASGHGAVVGMRAIDMLKMDMSRGSNLGKSTSPPGRNGAFSQAKRDAGISSSQQPETVRQVPMTDRNGNWIMGKNGKPIMTREYIFKRADGSQVIIQEHSAGHDFGGVGNQGPHFNVRPINNTRTGTVPGTQEHYPFNP